MTELDPVIHAQARLRVCATLATLPPGESMSFPRLQELLDMTPGNLTTHLRKLEEPGYIEISKKPARRAPATFVRLTSRGRLAFTDYREALRALLEDVEGS